MSSFSIAKPLGFTMIEMVIVMAILAISMALGVPGYRAWVENTKIRNAAESIQNGLQRARTEAVVRNVNVAFTLLGTDSSWQVSCCVPAVIIDSRSGSDGSKNVIATGFDKNTNGAAATTVTFSSLTTVQSTNADGSAPLRRVQVVSTGLSAADSRDLWVTVGTGDVGSNIRMCDPAPGMPASDPRKC